MGDNTQTVCLQILCLGGDSLLEMTKKRAQAEGMLEGLILKHTWISYVESQISRKRSSIMIIDDTASRG